MESIEHLFDFGALPIETRLLLLLTKPQLSRADRESAQALMAETVNWPAFVQLANRHGVLSMVYQALKRENLKGLPATVTQELHAAVYQHRLRSLVLSGELARLAYAFSTRGIQMVSFKGPSLSEYIFADLTLRFSVDLDLMVSPKDLEAATQLLQENGYVLDFPRSPLTPRQREQFERISAHYEFFRSSNQVRVELHWKVSHNPYLFPNSSLPQVLARTQTVQIGGAQVGLLGPEDLLIYLILHATKHKWSQLKWLCDVTHLFRRLPPEHWQLLLQRTEEWNLQRPVSQGIFLAHLLYGLDVPGEVWAFEKADRRIRGLVQVALQDLLRVDPHAARPRLQKLHVSLYNFNLKKDWRYRWYNLLDLWQDPRDWDEVRLPDVLFPLYALLRPFLWSRRQRDRGD